MVFAFGLCGRINAGSLRMGCATVDITPDRPVALAGNFRTKISQAPATPIIAAALAIEAPHEEAAGDHVLLITCDLVAIRDGVQIKARSPALQTFLIQHAGNAGLYLPTEKAIEGGGYSGLPHTNLVGPNSPKGRK